MTHIKCLQCGLNNWDGAEVCDRCRMPLHQKQPEPVTTATARPDVPVFLTLGGDAPTRSRTWKAILAVMITLVVGAGSWALYRRSAGSSRGREATRKRTQLVERTVDERTRDAVLSCLAQ